MPTIRSQLMTFVLRMMVASRKGALPPTALPVANP
jgi:hypothetical protein